MKIGVLHHAFDLYGGAEYVALVVTNALAREDYDVELMVGKKPLQEEVRKMMGEGIDPSVGVTIKPSVFKPRGLWHLPQVVSRSLILKSRNDLLIDTYSNTVLPWTDISYIHFPFLNDYFYKRNFPYLNESSFANLIGIPYVVYAKELEDYQDKLIITNSIFTADAIRKGIEAEVTVLYPPIQSTFFEEPLENLDRPRENLVITVSRFSAEKDLERIPLTAKLCDGDTSFTLLGLLQDQVVYERLKRTIHKLGVAERVKLMPNASRDDVKRLLKKAKIYLHTMIGEHFGISIVEAMAAGCVPIVHNSGGMKEFVPREYRYESVKEAAEKIRKNLAEWTPKKAAQMRKIAEEFKEENFSRKFLETFRKYVNNHPGN